MTLRQTRQTIPAAPLRWSWSDRLCAAHFAVIMFGLVALVGPAHSAGAMLLAVGLVAVMCLAVHGALLVGNGVFRNVRDMFETRVLPCTALPNVMLQFLRRSSLLAGAPPAVGSWKSRYRHNGGEDVNVFTSFVFPLSAAAQTGGCIDRSSFIATTQAQRWKSLSSCRSSIYRGEASS